MTQLESGSTLGKYQLLVRIGHGGMASVWVARERSLQSGKQRLVAVKAMLPELARQAAFRAMFLEEVQLVRSIQHEHVVQVYDVSEDSGILYMAMEWVEGESLRNVIRAASGRRPIPSEIAVHVIADAASGLHAAHELRGWDGELRGVVHCDVSPHNILLGVDGRAKLVDFGVAGALEQLESQGLKGKVGYMAPEQARGGPVDRRTDVYALGIVLFELTTGTALFATGSRSETLKLVADPVIPLPSDIVPGYSSRLESIVLRALERNPAKRYPTAEELRDALHHHLVEERVVVSRAGVAQLMRKVVGNSIKQRRQQIALALREFDGEVPAELVAQWPGLASPNYWSFHSDEPGAPSQTSVTLTDIEPVGLQHQTLSSSATITGTVSKHGMSWGAILGLVLGVATVALVVGYLASERLRAPHKRDVTNTAETQASPSATSKAPPNAPEEITDVEALELQGVNIESLPLEQQARLRRAQSLGFGRSGRAASAKSATKDANGSAPETPSGQEGQGYSFNRPIAVAGLNRASSGAVSCSKPEGPKGSGTATVTFAPGGQAQSVRLSFRFAGTEVGSCVLRQFAKLRVPPFDGAAVTLSQSFQVP
jgi:eukaryotic-like serine/threonine-protein kinase